jgi:hypothetical protein
MTAATVNKCQTWFTLIIFNAQEIKNNGGGEQGLLIA